MKNNKQHIEKVTKPFMRGDAIDSTTMGVAVKFFFGTLGMTVAFLLMGVMMNWSNQLVSIAINGCIILAMLLIFHQTGSVSGADAVNQGEIMLAREAKGRPVEAWERKHCYHPLKGLIAALIGSLPLIICAVILACTAQIQVSNLGALPSWLGSLESRPEIGNALAFYHEKGSMSLEGSMRLVIRMATMPYVNMIGANNKEGLLLLERISPILMLLPAGAYGLGYAMGTGIRTAVHTNIALGKKKIKRKQQKERRARQRTRSGPEQLN